MGKVLSHPCELTAKRANGKRGHKLSECKRPSAWDLSLDGMQHLVPGGLVLADRAINSIPECSLGVVVQTLEAHLVQVVFPPKSR